MNTLAVQRPIGTDPSTLLPARGLLLQRKCACGGSAGTSGICEACADKGRLQARLAVGTSNDPLELEADRVANQELAASGNATVSGTSPHIQRLTGPSTGRIHTGTRQCRPRPVEPWQAAGTRIAAGHGAALRARLLARARPHRPRRGSIRTRSGCDGLFRRTRSRFRRRPVPAWNIRGAIRGRR